MLGRAVLLLGLIALLAAPARAEDAPPVPFELDAAIAAWRRAHAAEESARARAIAQARHVVPARAGARMLEGASDAGALLAELRRWAADAAGHPGLPGLEVLVQRIAAKGAEALERERVLAAAAGPMRAAKDLATAERVRRRVVKELAPPGSHAAWRLRHLYAAALQRLDPTAPALVAHDLAAGYARISKLRASAAQSWVAASKLASARGDADGARDRAERALVDARASGHPGAIREAVSWLAGTAFRAGRLQAALDVLRANMPTEAWLDPRDRHAYYRAAFNIFAAANQPIETLALARSMHENAKRVDGPTPKAMALRNLAYAQTAVGSLQGALDSYRQALEHDLSTDPRLERLIHAGLSGIWIQLGRPADAEMHARAALAISSRLGPKSDEGQDSMFLAQALGGRGRWTEALALAREALRIAEDSKNARIRVEAQGEVARLMFRAGAVDESFALLEKARAAAAALPDAQREAYMLWQAGSYRFKRGAFAEALADADRGRALLHPSHEFQERFARLRTAALHHLGRHEACLAEARKAIEGRRRMLAGLSASDARAAQRSLANMAGFGLRSAVALARPADAFWLIESSRAMQMNIALRAVRGRSLEPLGSDLQARERATQDAVAKAHAALNRVVQDPGAAASVLGAAVRAHEAAWAERDRALAEIERVSRRAAVAAGGRSVTLEDFRRLLRPQEAWVAYQDAGDRMMALVVGREALALADLGPRAPLERMLEDWRRALSTPGADDRALGRKLHAALLAPLSAPLAGVTRLLISPAGALAAVPLAALPAGKGARLVDTHDVLYVPSATSYAILHGDKAAARGSGLVAVAGPEYAGTGLAALPHAFREAQGIEPFFPEAQRTRLAGRSASLAAVRALAAAPDTHLRALHFAAHAFVDPERPQRNGIALSGGAMLTTSTVQRLRLPSDLVVLSCCDSARGTPTEGEGQRGLVRAFLVAGARRVVASCWRVRDDTTPAFMARFYALWEGEGRDVAAALRSVQREQRRAGVHPSAWASFVAWGLP